MCTNATRQETIMRTETNAKATLPQRAMHELKEFVFLSLYLYIAIGAVILMKTAVLHTQGVEFTPWPSPWPSCWRNSCCSAAP
jgi:hypothetical protein